MDRAQIIQKTADFIAREFASEGSGHDWFHIDRVRRLAVNIGQIEGSEAFITEMAALLHDLDDWKISGNQSHFPDKANKWLLDLDMEVDVIAAILQVIEDVAYQGVGTETRVRSIEGAVVQDADRLDAIGAIGIARTFAYGGHKGRLIYDPAIVPVMHSDFQSYQNSTAPTVNHFFEKLFLLKDRMNTNTAKSIAEQRHRLMENYLEQFFYEWEAKI
ncbi:MAG TPA: HD domain-containing protein [Prolixibacteraceae bacterium]|jgi:uncharacterized protein